MISKVTTTRGCQFRENCYTDDRTFLIRVHVITFIIFTTTTTTTTTSSSTTTPTTTTTTTTTLLLLLLLLLLTTDTEFTLGGSSSYTSTDKTNMNTVIPRLTKIIRSGITFVSPNVISCRFL